MTFSRRELTATLSAADLAPYRVGDDVDLTRMRRALSARFPGAQVILTPGNGYTQTAQAVPAEKAVGMRVNVYLRGASSPDVTEVDVELPEVVDSVEQMWANA